MVIGFIILAVHHRTEFVATQEMHVNVKNGLARIFVGVDGKTVSGFVDAILPGHLLRDKKNPAESPCITLRDLINRWYSLPRNDEQMHLCLTCQRRDDKEIFVAVKNFSLFTVKDTLEDGFNLKEAVFSLVVGICLRYRNLQDEREYNNQ